MPKKKWFEGARTGPSRYFFRMRVFACEGMIAIIDERDGDDEGDCKVIPPDQFRQRVYSLSRPYRKQTPSEMTPWQRERYLAQVRSLQGMLECIKEAKDMGDPTSLEVRQFWMKQRGRSKVSFSSPYADFPAIPTPAGFPQVAQPRLLTTPSTQNPAKIELAPAKSPRRLILPS